MMTRVLKAGVVVGVLGLAVPTAFGTRYFVEDDASLGGDGSDWLTGTPYKYLQDALYAAGSGDEIWVAAGTYRPDEDEGSNVTPDDRSETFQIISGVTVYGGFAGDEDPATFDLDDRDFDTNETILSGDLAEDDGTGMPDDDNSYHVVTMNSSGVLDGCTVTRGRANGAAADDKRGAGVFCDDGDPTIRNCIVARNRSDGPGAGFYCCEGSPTFETCFIVRNFADLASYGLGGGGLAFYSDSVEQTCQPQITDCVIAGNTASGASGAANGGGIGCLGACETLITRTVFSGNHADQGAGFYAWHNSLSGTDEHTIRWCTFAGNSTDAGGGGLFCTTDSEIDVLNALLVGNDAATQGGAIHCQSDGSVALLDSSVVRNEAAAGGGCWYYNVAQGVGSSTPSIINSILWSNAASNGNQIGIQEGFSASKLDVSYSDVEGGEGDVYESGAVTLTWTSNINLCPLFLHDGDITGTWTGGPTVSASDFTMTLTDSSASWTTDEHVGRFLQPDTDDVRQLPIVANTTTTVTVWIDSSEGGWINASGYDDYAIYDYHVHADSPVVDAGSNAAVPGAIDEDIDGDDRIINDDVDMGYDEVAGGTGTFCNDPPQDTDGDGDVDLTDYSVMLGCYNGPGNPYADDCETCICVDSDGDGDVDLTDYSAFLDCYNGPGNPPSC